jgi:hypothetical protein
MNVCPRCKFENLDTGGGECLACGIDIQWALLNPNMWNAMDITPDEYKAAVQKRKRYSDSPVGQQSFSPNAQEPQGATRKKRLFQNGSNITLSQKEEIKITKKTISFGRDVYQFHNVVGFSDGEVDFGKIIPMSVVLIGIFVGFLVASFPFAREYGILLLGLSFVGKYFSGKEVWAPANLDFWRQASIYYN